MKTRYLIPMTTLLLLLGCSSPKQSERVLIIDKTEKYMPLDAQSIFDLYKGIHYGRITITETIDQSVSNSSIIYKQKSPSYLFRIENKEREKEVNFERDFMRKFQLFNQPSGQLEESYVYSVLARELKRLASSTADDRSVLVFGDLCENTHNFRFYDYRKDPARILEDYDLIVEVLERQSPRLKDADLRGIKISVVHHPDKENDHLLRYVWEFWSKYFQSRHAEIEFVTSLENSSLIQGL